MSVIEIHGCDLRKKQFTSINDGELVVGQLLCEDSDTNKALLITDSTGKNLFCANNECIYNNGLAERIKKVDEAKLKKEMVSDFT